MVQRIFHGQLEPEQISQALIANFNRGNLLALENVTGDQIIVQVASRQRPVSGGQTALTVIIKKVADGVAVELGKQAWLGVAASLGVTALSAWRNPLSLLNRLDDIAQDLENLQLSDEVWAVIENVARVNGASFELSERLRRLVCEYCLTANPVGNASCIACGAPLGNVQPVTCRSCGFVMNPGEFTCPNCGQHI